MKKLFVVAIAAMLCVCFAMPAAAQVQVSGMIWVDAYMRKTDGFAQAGGVTAVPPAVPTTLVPGQKDLQINLPTPTNYVSFRYTNKAATLGGSIQFFMGQINHRDNSLDIQGNASMWWKPMDNLTVHMGMLPQIVGGLAPSMNLGMNEYYRSQRWDGVSAGVRTPYQVDNERGANVPAFITFGNVHFSSRPGFAIDYKFSDMITLKVGLYDPDDDGSDLNPRTPRLTANVPGSFASLEPRLPRIDVAVPINFGNFYIQPKAAWLKNTFENVAPNQDDDFTAWMMGADAKVTFGPVYLAAEYAFGENLGGTCFTCSSLSFAPTTYINPATGYRHISDVDEKHWWAEIGWTITPRATLMFAYGKSEFENLNDPANPNDNWIFERSSWALALRYAIMPNFFMVPAYQRWDFGDDNDLGLANPFGALRQNAGKRDIYGVTFFMMF